jgi:Uma2 family endonuclease
MSEATPHARWTWEAYLEWEAGQSLRHELVDGQVRAMVGGTAGHDTIANNLRRELWSRLRGGPCRVQGPDLKVQAGRNAWYPDAVIDCGPSVPEAVVAQNPVAVFEVLSKSTAWIDQGLKLRDYNAAPSIRYCVLISQDEARALIYTRDSDGRLDIGSAVLLEGMDAGIELSELGVTLAFSALYEDVTFAG